MDSNPNKNKIKLTPFIPPQLYNRFADLSKNTYIAHRQHLGLKTLIRIGDEDLILYTKRVVIKNGTTWRALNQWAQYHLQNGTNYGQHKSCLRSQAHHREGTTVSKGIE